MKWKYDWAAIQDYYDEGHSLQECRAKFGFANGAWDSAVGRGEIVPRADKRPRFRHDTRAAVRWLLESGMSQTEAAFELGVSRGTVCYHVRQLGIEGDARFRRRYDWAEIQRAHDGWDVDAGVPEGVRLLDRRTKQGSAGRSRRELHSHRSRSCSSPAVLEIADTCARGS
jgi:hypothetical protein